jgi:hypothetical protein
VTTAALMDSDVHCHAELDRKFLVHGKILMTLSVRSGLRPVTRGRAFADVTFPTISIRNLLKKFAKQLKEIKVPASQLGRDRVDANRIRLGIFAARQAAAGKDIFLRKTVRVPLLDDGKAPDVKAKDGRYTAFFDVKSAKVAGNFDIRIRFEVRNKAIGTHRCVEYLPVFVPEL